MHASMIVHYFGRRMRNFIIVLRAVNQDKKWKDPSKSASTFSIKTKATKIVYVKTYIN